MMNPNLKMNRFTLSATYEKKAVAPAPILLNTLTISSILWVTCLLLMFIVLFYEMNFDTLLCVSRTTQLHTWVYRNLTECRRC